VLGPTTVAATSHSSEARPTRITMRRPVG
jgi:hypothetical protein